MRRELETALPRRPFAIRFWDGSWVPATEDPAPTFSFRSPRALAHVLRAPGELGLGRAYVAGLLEVDDLDAALRIVDTYEPPSLSARQKVGLATGVVRACGLVSPPKPPEAELRLRGERHTLSRDRRAVRHHYDVGNEFFALFLDESMTYSCAYFAGGAETLEEAQEAKLELVCRKLGLQAGERVLDVGCGWGSFAIHAARRHGVQVLGVTLSAPQVAARAGAGSRGGGRGPGRVPGGRLPRARRPAVRRDLEHRDGRARGGGADRPVRADAGRSLLRPGGRLLNHGIAKLQDFDDADEGDFSERFVFPDGTPLPLSRVLRALERTGLVDHPRRGLADDYARDDQHWISRFEERYADAVRLAGVERARVWRLYLRAAHQGFATGWASVYQVLAHKP